MVQRKTESDKIISFKRLSHYTLRKEQAMTYRGDACAQGDFVQGLAVIVVATAYRAGRLQCLIFQAANRHVCLIHAARGCQCRAQCCAVLRFKAALCVAYGDVAHKGRVFRAVGIIGAVTIGRCLRHALQGGGIAVSMAVPSPLLFGR